MQPHVFLIRGDLTKLSCDAWLLPTSAAFSVTPDWRQNVTHDVHAVIRQLYDGQIAAPDDWGRDKGRVLALDRWLDLSNLPRPYLVNVGARAGMPAEWYIAGVREFFKVAAADPATALPLHKRVSGHEKLPIGGHEISPQAVTKTPQ